MQPRQANAQGRLQMRPPKAEAPRGSSLTCTAQAANAGSPENVQPEESRYPENVARTTTGPAPIKSLTGTDNTKADERFATSIMSPRVSMPLQVLPRPAGVARRSSAPPSPAGAGQDGEEKPRLFTAQDTEERPRFYTVQDEADFSKQRLKIMPCVSTSGSLSTGSYTMWGEKKSWHKKWVSQDANLMVHLPENRVLVAVFDGHGESGHHVAGQVKRLFEQHAQAIADDPCSPAAGLIRVFALCQATFEQQEELCSFSGCTATVAILDPNAQTATTAFAGDSTLLVARQGAAVWATEDHKLDAEAERRILARGGEVRSAAVRGSTVAVRRVFSRGGTLPGLAMSRALGDLEACRLGVLPEPEVSTVPFDPDSALIVASDGLWDVLPHEAVAARLASAADADAVARSLVLDARSRYPTGSDIDDITAVVVLPRGSKLGCSSVGAKTPGPPLQVLA